MKHYRLLLALAATYNVAFALFSGLFPREFFAAFETDPTTFAIPWPLMAGVVGTFGLFYAIAAWKTNRGDVLVAIGLATKILGPAGWLLAVHLQTLPPQLFPLVLAGDLVWCFPLLFYLLRNTAWRGTVIAWLGVALHVLACAGLLVIAPGTEATVDMAARQAWIARHEFAWTATWAVWSLASISLLAFCVAWYRAIARDTQLTRRWLLGVVIVGVGLVFDLCGETMLVARATGRGLDLAQFEAAVRMYQLLSPGVANGLYCLGGLLLSIHSWRGGWLQGKLGVMGLVMWSLGFGLSLAVVVQSRLAMTVTGAGVMLLFIPWSAAVGWRLRPQLVSDSS